MLYQLSYCRKCGFSSNKVLPFCAPAVRNGPPESMTHSLKAVAKIERKCKVPMSLHVFLGFGTTKKPPEAPHNGLAAIWAGKKAVSRGEYRRAS
ncbi:MAG: hypothetical protein MR971_05750 [Bacteroidales bacterium]|nr:hypothetical protein [Bacteroidales bacterium]